MKQGYVYIMTNINNTTVYVGVTSNLERRVYEHQHEILDGFTKQYQLHKLVYFETCNSVEDAIAREKQLKHWSRAKKNQLIESLNPTWKDLSNWQ